MTGPAVALMARTRRPAQLTAAVTCVEASRTVEASAGAGAGRGTVWTTHDPPDPSSAGG